MTEDEQKQLEKVMSDISQQYTKLSNAYNFLVEKVVKEGHEDWLIPSKPKIHFLKDGIYSKDAWSFACKKLGMKVEVASNASTKD